MNKTDLPLEMEYPLKKYKYNLLKQRLPGAENRTHAELICITKKCHLRNSLKNCIGGFGSLFRICAMPRAFLQKKNNQNE